MQHNPISASRAIPRPISASSLVWLMLVCVPVGMMGVGIGSVSADGSLIVQEGSIEGEPELTSAEGEQIVGDSTAAPSWISVEREIDEAEGVERRLVVGTRSTDVTTLESDFRLRALEITRQYLSELLGERADTIKLDESRLSSVIAPRRVFVERTSEGEGVSFVRYGQLVFDESFRRWAIGEGRRSQQWSRLMVWVASFGGLVVILSAGALRVRLSRRDDASLAA